MYLLNPITSSFDCAEYARQHWINILDHESVYAMYLNDKFEMEYFKQLNVSNYRKTLFESRTLLRYALNLNIDHVILFHNHISGDVSPSETDKQLTELLIPFYEFVSVHLADHIIINVNRHYSFADNGLIQGR